MPLNHNFSLDSKTEFKVHFSALNELRRRNMNLVLFSKNYIEILLFHQTRLNNHKN